MALIRELRTSKDACHDLIPKVSELIAAFGRATIVLTGYFGADYGSRNS